MSDPYRNQEEGLPNFDARTYVPPPYVRYDTAPAYTSRTDALPHYTSPAYPLDPTAYAGYQGYHSRTQSNTQSNTQSSYQTAHQTVPQSSNPWANQSQSGYASDSSYVSSSSGNSYATAASGTAAMWPHHHLPTPYTLGSGASRMDTAYGGSSGPSSQQHYTRCNHQTCPGSVCQSNTTYNPAQAERFLASNYAPIPREQETWNQRRERESRNAQWRANARPGIGQYDWKDYCGNEQRGDMHDHTEGCAKTCAKKLGRREQVKESQWISYAGRSGYYGSGRGSSSSRR